MRKTYYTAVGHFRRKTDDNGQSYPVILNNQEEYLVDMQEMTVWTALNWRIAEFPQLEKEYDRLSWGLRSARIPHPARLSEAVGYAGPCGIWSWRNGL